MSNLIVKAGLCIRWPQCPSGPPCTPPCRPPAPLSTLQWVCLSPRSTRNNPSLPLQVSQGNRQIVWQSYNKIHLGVSLLKTFSLYYFERVFITSAKAQRSISILLPQCFNQSIERHLSFFAKKIKWIEFLIRGLTSNPLIEKSLAFKIYNCRKIIKFMKFTTF